MKSVSKTTDRWDATEILSGAAGRQAVRAGGVKASDRLRTNGLTLAGASKGHFPLLLFGLGLSIPLVVFTSNSLAKLMDRYPAIICVGAAIIGKVGGEMIMTDRLVEEVFHPARWLTHAVEGLLALGVILVALGWRRTRRAANH